MLPSQLSLPAPALPMKRFRRYCFAYVYHLTEKRTVLCIHIISCCLLNEYKPKAGIHPIV